MNRTAKFDRFLYALCAAAFLVSAGYILFWHPEVRNVSERKESIGYVVPYGQDVRLRGEKEMSWNQLRGEGLRVFRRDRVFTGAKSTAEIKFKSKNNFTIEPNSMVIVSDEDDSTFNLESGSFLSDLKKGARIFVTSGQQVTEIKSDGATIRFESGNGKKPLKLVVLKGQASIQATDSKTSQTVNANEEALVKEKNVEVRPLEISLAKPEPGETLWTQSQLISFAWKAPTQTQPLTLEIATDPLFNNRVKHETVRGNTYSTNLAPDQVYFWRIRAQDSQSSPTSSFAVYVARPPLVHKSSELHVETTLTGTTTNPVTFAWRDPNRSESYDFQLAKDMNFTDIEYNGSTEQTQVDLADLHTGEYYWRVISKHTGRENLSSEVAFLKILSKDSPASVHEAEPPTPRGLAQATPAPQPTPEPVPTLGQAAFEKGTYNFELTQKGLGQTPVPPGFIRTEAPTLKWNQAIEAEVHTVEVSYFPDFRTPREFQLKESPWTWPDVESGNYFVRIRAQRGSDVSYSPPVQLRVILAPPQFKSFELEEPPGDAAQIHGSLNTHTQAKQVEFQVSTDESFKNPARIKGPPTLNYKVSEPGTYLVRARHLNAQGWPISRFSSVQRIHVRSWVPEEPPILSEAQPHDDQMNSEPRATPEPLEAPKPARDPAAKPRLRLWGGTGADYLRFSQSSGSDLESGTFSKLMAPTYMAGANLRFGENSNLQVEYHDWPGQITTKGDVQLDKTRFDWRSISGEYQHQFWQKNHVTYSGLLGLQVHQVPFLSQNSDGSISLLENELRNLSGGLKLVYAPTADFEYEGFMRYQTLLSSKSTDGAQFSAKGGTMFDGSLGVTRKYLNGLRLGVFWFGQYQSLNYDFTRDGSSSTGSQSFFNSNFQLRIGYDIYGMIFYPFLISGKRRRRKKY